VVIILQDVSERERQWAEAQGQMAALGRSQAMVEFDLHGNILAATMIAKRLVKFSPEGALLEAQNLNVSVWAVAVSEGGAILLCTSRDAVGADCTRERSGAIQRVVT
jgi:hypothetical protein